MQALQYPPYWSIFSDSHIDAVLYIPDFYLVEVVPKEFPQYKTGKYQSDVEPEEGSDELADGDEVVLHVQSELRSREAI